MEKKRCYGCMSPLEKGDVCPHCGYDRRTQNAPHQLAAGTVLKEQYLIGKVLGQGGFGITYLGWDLYLDIPVAIKEYYPSGMVMRENSVTNSVTGCSGDDDRFHNNRDRFMREAKMLARFAHVPEIVQVKNFFLANNTAYIVMEYIQGITLKEYVRRRGGRLKARETFAILRPIMAALEKLHKAGIVHRDISPDNIMMLRGGGAKLLDFGAVRDVGMVTDVEKELTKSTEAILKQGYAPMEQYQHRGALGPWTDVYALCATVYYCLTGTVPPDAPARMLDDMPLSFDAQTGLNPQQQSALLKGMALRTADRLHSMEELLQELFSAPIPHSDDVPVPPQPTEVPEPIKPESPKPEKAPRQKKPGKGKKWIAIFAVLILLIAGGLGAWYLTDEKPLPVPSEETSLPTEETTLPTEETTQPTETEPVVADPVENAMKAFPVEDYKTAAQTSAFGTAASREQVLSITVLATVKDAPQDAVDISEKGNGKVLAWAVPNGDLYDLYLGSEGGIYAPGDCGGLFACYSKVKTIDFGGVFYTDNVKDMSYMFQDCWAVEVLKVDNFDTRNVTNMSYMFRGCLNIQELAVSNFSTGKVNNMKAMFEKCETLTELDVSGFDTSKVTVMSHMFSECRSLRSLDVSGFDTTNVTNMGYMFSDCNQLKAVDVSGFKTGEVKTMEGMFQNCWAVEALDLSSFDTQKVVNMGAMFQRCFKLTELTLSSFDTQMVVDMRFMFYGCTSLEALDVSGFDTSKVTDMCDMFFNCSALTAVDVSGFETGEVTNMGSMFHNCSALTAVDVSGFDTTNVTNMSDMFSDCNQLKAVDVSGFETGEVTNMGSMFHNCSALTAVDVSSFDTQKVVNMRFMFCGCTSLEALDVSGFDTSKVKNMGYMFYGCDSLTNLKLGEFSTASVTNHENFMEPQKKADGKPWEQLFA